ncbi:hypothetical protein QUB70_06300 [Microcoleus sp. A003_D6]
MPIPQNFFLVEWASCPFQNLIKRIFARGLLMILPLFGTLCKRKTLRLLGFTGSRGCGEGGCGGYTCRLYFTVFHVRQESIARERTRN